MQRYIDLLLSSLGGENSTSGKLKLSLTPQKCVMSGAGEVVANEALAVAEGKNPLAVLPKPGRNVCRHVLGYFLLLWVIEKHHVKCAFVPS